MPPQRLHHQHARSEWRHALPLLASIVLVWLLEHATPGGPLLIPQLRYLAAHNVFETIALVLAALCFSLLWMAPDSARRAGTVLLAAALAGAAVLDFLHMLSYEGMPQLVTPSGVEKSIAFWLAGRTLMALGLLAMALMPDAKALDSRERLLVLGAVFAAVACSTWVILYRPHWLPATFVAGTGLTHLKVGAELVLIGVLLFAAWRLQRRATSGDTSSMSALSVAAVLAAAGELCFASYSNASDLFNGIGHIAKISAYWYITRAAYLLAVRQPLAAAGDIADALQATLNPALICNADGIVRWANSAFLQTTGLTNETLIGRSINTLEVPGHEQDWTKMRNAMHDGLSWKGQVYARRSDGTLYVDDRSLTPMHGPQGHVSGYVLLGDDITERERVADELRDSEERLRVLLDSAPDAVVVIDSRGRIQLANPEVERMFGYSRSEVIGANVSLLMPPAMAAQHDTFLQRFSDTGIASIIGNGRDVVAQRKDGHLLHVHLTVGRAQFPGGTAFIGFMRDISERIQAQTKLAESEERYRALMDTALDGMWITDSEGRILAVNDAYCQRSGYSRSELLKLRIPDIEASESGTDVANHINHVIQHGHDTFETRHRSKAGEEWPVEITVTYWPLGRGQLFVFARDLTERQAAALALRQSEERFALALRGANDGLWDRDLIKDTLYLSPRWKEMLGYRDEELPNSREVFASLLHPSDALAVHLALSDVASGQGGERIEMEMRLRHKDGHWVHVLSRGQLVRDVGGRPLRLIGTHQDLTERKRAEAALRESEDKLRNLFELSPLGIALCTLDGRLIEFNEAYRALTGYSPQELRRLSYWDLTPSEYMHTEASQLEHVTRSGRYGPYEKEYLRADGTRVPVRLNGVRIDIDGQPYLWSIAEDLTESRRVESERQSMQRQQLQSQKLEALGHLTGGIAHDFNNMLAGIMGLANLGLARFITEPEGKLAQYLREIVRTSERGRDLVAKMLAYVRTEEPETAEARQLAPLLVEMCAILRSSIPSTITVDCSHEEDLPPVRITAVDMHQIVMNLVINARDAIGVQGHISIRLERQRLVAQICTDCQARVDGDFLVLEVADDGPGIPRDVLPKIFDPFFTTKGVGKGTGLGLSSVVGLVHKAGGHMQVVDRNPRGTAMRVWLPVASNGAEATSPESPPPASVQRNDASLWVVDDDPAVLVFLTELLEEHGFAVRAFADPRMALQALQDANRQGSSEQRPSVLISDQTMPRLAGSELAQAAMEVQPGLPVILCTGYSEVVDAEKAQALGIRHFLRKPFDSRDLFAALNDVLGA